MVCNTNQATVYQIKTCLRNCSYIAERPIDTHNIKINSLIFVHTHEHKHKQRVGIAQLNRRSLQTHDRLECQKCTLTSHTSKISFACADSWPLAAHTNEGYFRYVCMHQIHSVLYIILKYIITCIESSILELLTGASLPGILCL